MIGQEYSKFHQLVDNLLSSVESANTVWTIMEGPCVINKNESEYPFSCNYYVHIYIGTNRNSTTLGHGDVYIFIDKESTELKGVRFSNCKASFILICKSLQLCYGVPFVELQEIEGGMCLFVF